MLCLSTIVICAGCQSEATPVVFAAAAPWRESYSLGTRQGIELAVSEINAAGGIAGQPLRIRWCDDGGSASGAVSVAQSVVADPNVVAVIGHINSGAQLAAASVYDGHLVAISPQATSPDLTGLSRWLFRDLPSDSTNGATLARFAGHLGAHRAAVLYENDAYGRGLARAFRRHFIGTVLISDPIDAAASSYEPYVTYLKAMRPDAVFVAGLGPSGLGILREAKRQGLSAPFLGGDGWTGVADDTIAGEGAYVATPFLSSGQLPEVRRFDAAFQARFHIMPEEDMALAYDATQVLAAAVAHGGRDRTHVRAYLASLTAQHPFLGVTGPLYFLPDGDPGGRQFIMSRVHKGGFVGEATQ